MVAEADLGSGGRVLVIGRVGSRSKKEGFWAERGSRVEEGGETSPDAVDMEEGEVLRLVWDWEKVLEGLERRVC